MNLEQWKEKINVLVIEDNLDLLEMEETLLSQNGYKNLFLAKNSDEAEHFLKNKKIDLCLSDIKFPTKNGVEVMKDAKKENLTPEILIFLSGFNDFKLEELKSVGACQYFEKPVKFDELLKYIDNLFYEKVQKVG